MGDLPEVSVVVASYNRRLRLPALVEAVLADEAASELIVVVDGCDDGSIEFLQQVAADEPRLRPIRVSHRGHLACLDAGVRMASSRVVLLLDDDVLPHEGLVSSHAAWHCAKSGLVVMGYMPVRLPKHRRHGDVGTYVYAGEYEMHCSRIERGELAVLDGLWAGNVSMSREVCLAVGLQSEKFPLFYHSDMDLGLRLKAAGLEGVFSRSLVASHLHERSTAAFLRDAIAQGAGDALVHQVHESEIGSFDPTRMYADLPAPLRVVVFALGSSRHAGSACRLLTALAGLFGRLHWFSAETAVAKLARRVLQLHGAPGAVPHEGKRRIAFSKRSSS